MDAAQGARARSTRTGAQRWTYPADVEKTANGENHSQDLPFEMPRARRSEISLALARCQHGSGAVVWTGEPGMGKSALLAHAIAAATERDYLVIRVPVNASDLHGSDDELALSYVVRHLLDATPDLDSVKAAPSAPSTRLKAATTEQSTASLARSLADLIAAGRHKRAVVFAVDDLENLDETTSRTLIGAIAERRTAAVLLATASDPNFIRALPHEVERRPLAPITNSDALVMLQESVESTVAPRVIQVLNEHVGGAPTALVETAQSLSSAQLGGRSQLPDPLPVAASMHRALSQDLIGMPASQRKILLIAAISVTARTDLFLAATGLEIDELLASSAARHLRLVAGHISISDPRIRAVIHADASVGERTAAHETLAKAHKAAGSEITALWHHALASLTGDAGLSKQLLTVAERMLNLGDAAWAQRVAREGLSHATGADRPDAMIMAGRAALHAGHTSDALGLLREAARILPDGEAAKVSAALTAAVSFATGQVPDEVVQNDAPDCHTQLLAAVFYAERGDMESATKLADALDPGDSQREQARVELLRSWLQSLKGRPDPSFRAAAQFADDPLFITAARIVRSFSLLQTGAVREARRILSTTLSELSPATTSPWDPQLHDRASKRTAITPMLEAYLHVADIVVEYATGNISNAQKSLEQVAFRLPVSQPFAGLICIIAGRLSVLQNGHVGDLANVLEKLIPSPLAPPMRAELFANRAFAHLIAGETREAETLMDMTRSAQFNKIPLIARPNFFDISELLALPPALPHDMVVPDDDSLGTLDIIEVETDDVDALDMALRHLITGRRAAATASPAQAAEYLVRSAMLFEEIGAFAAAGLARTWADQIARGAALNAPPSPDPSSAVEAALAHEPRLAAPNPAPQKPDDNDLPRWAAVLTEREREVAQIIAEGASNREAAATLFVSVRTVEVHLTSIFRKLDIGSRVELAVVVSHAPLT